MVKKKKKFQRKEEIAEDWCFVCKDGGLLLVCDYKQCLKAYHPECVGKDESFIEAGISWNCNWHSCFICHRTPKFQCFCCPNAVCQWCITVAEFVQVRGKKGFCNNCLKLALLVEENMDVDSDGEKVDFKDRETCEFLFMEYWEIIKKEEGLTLENLQSANARLKDKNDKSGSDLDYFGKSEETDSDDRDDIEEHKPPFKRKSRKSSKGLQLIREAKSNKKEFISWGSKSLMQFLSSIGKDTSKKLSQHDVALIINRYINENKLFHPEKKKKIKCDARLESVLGRKKINRNKIYDLLEAHFTDNLDQSLEFGYDSEDIDENVVVAHKKQSKSVTERKSPKNEVAFNVRLTCFASIVAENIKLVYLKRSLVQELLKQPETFESKVVGSFVRIKSEGNDYFRRNSHQLAQVTGIRKILCRENMEENLLQVLNMANDIQICMLSDDDFSEEECEDLRQKVKSDLLKRPTIVELEQKARSLHEDKTKHWIVQELALLQNLIDRANEKGWRSELFEYLKRRQLLQTASEQSRLLQKFPTVIADVEQIEAIYDDPMTNNKQGDDDSPKSILVRSLDTYTDSRKDKTSSEEKGYPGHASIAGEKGKLTCPKVYVTEELSQQSHILDSGNESCVILQNEPHQSTYGKQNQAVDVKQGLKRSQEEAFAVQLVKEDSIEGF